MKLFIIRHGQTTNNVLMAGVYARRDKGEITAQQAEEEWLAQRVDDPSITEIGMEEATQLGAFYGEVFKATGSILRIMPSPFLRTCQTCRPLFEALGDQARVVVNPEIYENGGVYVREKQTGGSGGSLEPPGSLS
jgi:broad specificity phosphatase PhoE